jgi:hypothetical protein
MNLKGVDIGRKQFPALTTPLVSNFNANIDLKSISIL